MSFEDCCFDPNQFCGTARLFPLPNLVVFPHVMQPLHIFEPRYCDLLEEALEHDRLIAMAVLTPGWEKEYGGRPPIRPFACLCRVAAHHKTEKGTFNALLLGVRRIKIARELPPTKSFRIARCKLMEDVYPIQAMAQRVLLQRELVEAFRRILPKISTAQEQLNQLLSSEISLGMLTDIAAYTLNLSQSVKERLLAQPVADVRARLLLKLLTTEPRRTSRPTFPPQFSSN